MAGLRELRNGRVVVSDRLERTVTLVDFATGDMTAIGREGQGPGECGMPGVRFPLGGDSTLMLDIAAMRGLVLVGERHRLPGGRRPQALRPAGRMGGGTGHA
ncbi:MAG TPA: hypothetical protein VGA02_00535 [Gemmatimonadales bacterium]